MAISKDEANFLTAFEWNPQGDPAASSASRVLAFGTVVSSVIAMIIAVPIAVGIALFISHYAPRRLAAPLGVRHRPAGRRAPHRLRPLGRARSSSRYLDGFTRWLDQFFGWIPLFDDVEPGSSARSIFTVGILLAIMILPIITVVSREVFLQAPRMHEEAALALGATRWEMIRTRCCPSAAPA